MAPRVAVSPRVLVESYMAPKPDVDRPGEGGRRLPLTSCGLTWCGLTVRGLVRQNNEDTLWAQPVGAREGAGDSRGRATSAWPGLLLCVADGMGGALAGEIASSLAVNIVGVEMAQRADGVSESAGGADKLVGTLVASVDSAHAAIRRESESNAQRRGMGTTLTSVWAAGEDFVVAQVGDSRAYLFRGGHLKQLTKDQSLVGKLIEDGIITEEEAERIAGKNIILQALGTEEPLDVVAERLKLLVGDLLLLCTDGLSGVVSNKDLEDDLRRGGTPEELCLRLIQLAEKRGGPDNITVLIARVDAGR